MRQQAGEVRDIVRDNEPFEGCTTSQTLWQDGGYSVSHFALGAGTSISAESYAYEKVVNVWSGDLEVFLCDGTVWRLGAGEAIITPRDVPVGVRSERGSVYTEVSLRGDSTMNVNVDAGKVFELGALVPYREGQIVNRDIVADPALKFVVMSFDAGTGLAEHAAPGDALVLALDGEGVIGYEGEEHPIRAGESFKFDKGGRHYVKAVDSRFKMALLVTLA